MHAQQQDRQFWPKTFQIIQDIEPAFSRHTDVENDDIPILEAHTLDGLHGRLCFPESDFRKRFANRFFKPTPEDSVIVSNQYSHLKSCLGRVDGGNGIRSVKVVPVPGTLSTLSSPLSRNARSCIPTRPRSSRVLCRSSEAIRRIVTIIPSTNCVADSTFFTKRVCLMVALRLMRAKSILIAVQACPSSSWISRAIDLRSSSRTL